MNLNDLSKNELLNHFILLEDKISELESVIKILNMWIKENDYEIYPLIKMVNEKLKETKNVLNVR